MRKVLCIVAGGTVLSLAACSAPPAPPVSRAMAPLYDNLGSHHYAVTTGQKGAQKYFDQGLTLSYAFNHAEAIRAFRQATALDPGCAMCYWGIAFAYGPNINAPITEEAAREARQAIEQARAVAAGKPEKEVAFIEALATRYAADPKAERAPLDRAYADAMRGVRTRFPDDLDAATLFAQSLMDTSPWNYWEKNGDPRPFTREVLGALESVLARKPDHVGAIHLYIHAVEASPDPGRASQYADTLATLVPGAGHLVHMPAHIYLRTGRYNDASVANQHAIAADEAYFKGNAVAGNMMYQVGYYPHNIHFFVAAASMEGRQADALKAAEQVRANVHAEMLRDPAMGGMVQHMHLTPLYTKLRFAMWDAVLAEPAPPADLPFMSAMWHASRGLAFAATGHLQEAETERADVAALKDDPTLKTIGVSSVNVASAIVAIAHDVLAGEIETRRHRADQAVRRFAEAVALEDDLTYMEPPDWPIPVRQLQGAALVELGRAKEAEAAFRGDLKKFPDNGWSLSGLRASLEQQGRRADAAAVRARFEQTWRRSDIQLAAARPQAPDATRDRNPAAIR
jgi:tetratricopeptide (TPR) repeat protein